MQYEPQRVMIIDDEPHNLNLLSEMLDHAGYHVSAFPKGDMALQAASKEPPDIILLDIRMPGMNGYEVCRCFKEDEHLKSVPVIFLSALTEAQDKVQAFEAGGADYVAKPFMEVEVLARVEMHLRDKEYQEQLELLVQRLTRELAEDNRRLKIWDKAKNQWLETLAYELRSPLAGIFGITDMLFERLPLDSELQRLKKSFEISRHRIKKLVDDAMTITQIDVAGEDFELFPVTICPPIKEAILMIKGQYPDNQIRASLKSINDKKVLCDYHLIVRCFRDLLFTAIQCTPLRGNIWVSGTHNQSDIWVSIKTEGEHLSQRALQTFFEVCGQQTVLKPSGDWGLAPALASRIIQMFKGSISVRNRSKGGIAIEVRLPAMNGIR